MASYEKSVEGIPGTAFDLLSKVRETSPNVHCLTNTVAANVTANLLLAAGARPSMTDDPDEVAAFTGIATALLVNLGMLSAARRQAIEVSIDTATERSVPWVLDPVKVATSPSRLKFASRLLDRRPTAMRANASEAAALGAPPAGTVIARTGAEDTISGDDRTVVVQNGSPLADRVTAMGCAEGALIAAFLAVADNAFDATVGAILTFNVAAEIAEETAAGPGSFQPALLDALFGLDRAALVRHARIEES